MRERLGDVPVVVLEKGKQPGSHLLSGAVVNPSSLRELFRGHLKTADLPTYGEVPGEAVYVLTRRSSYRIPPPPTMRNHGNVILSVSELGRFLAEQAEAVGVVVLPETSATRLLVQHGRVLGVRTGDRGRGRAGEKLATFEAGNDIVAGLTVLAEGSQGFLTGAAIDEFGLRGANPQIWALGVKEVWRVRTPLRKIVHTMGWPLRTSPSFGEFGGSFIYPMGDELVTIGFVAGLESADVEFSVHDVLQEFKTHRLVWKILGGGERVAWGAKTITEGGYYSLPSRFNAPGLLLVGEGAGLVNVPRLKGVHYAIESGRLAAEAAFRALQRGEVVSRIGALDSYDAALRASKHWKELYEVRNMRQAFDKGFFVGGALASMMTVTKGRSPERPLPDRIRTRPRRSSGRDALPAIPPRTGSTSSTSCPRSSRPATGRATTSPTISRCARRFGALSPRRGSGCAPRTSTRSAETWATGWSGSRSRRRTAFSAARSAPKAGASRRRRAAPAPSTPSLRDVVGVRHRV